MYLINLHHFILEILVYLNILNLFILKTHYQMFLDLKMLKLIFHILTINSKH